MKKTDNILGEFLFLIILTSLLQVNLVAQDGWNLIYTFNEGGGSVLFKDSLNGFASSAPSGIYKTSDGGITWVILNIPNLNNSINKIISVGNNYLIGVGLGGTIIKSVEAGNTWGVKNIGSTDNLTSICSSTNGELFIWSTQRNIYKSIDNGENWSIYSLDTLNFSLTDISFSDQNIGFGVGYYETSIKTTDGGETWFSILPIIPGRSMFAIKFVNESIGYVAGGEQIAKTSNGGNSWIVKYSGGSQLNDITTWNTNIAWVVGSDKIVKTIDSGENWMQQTFSPYHYLISAECVDSLICFASGGNVLYKTTNGGITTSVEDNKKILDLFILNQNYPNPFNPNTTISYQLPKTSFVTLKVYDLLGREVATLVNEEKPAGNYEVEFNGNGLSSGIYFYKLQTENYSLVKKMILIK